MSIPSELDRQQLEKLDQTSLIELILTMQRQLAEQQVLIQALRAIGQRQPQQRQTTQQRWTEKAQNAQSASERTATKRGTSRSQRRHLENGGRPRPS